MAYRALVAGFADWWGLARLPRTLAHAGCRVTTLTPKGQLLAASRFVSERLDAPGDIDGYAAALDLHLGSRTYDLVILGDEPILQAAAGSPAGSALRRALPVPEERAEAVAAKDAFMRVVEAAGVPVPRWERAEDPPGVRAAAARMGSPVYVKSLRSWGGMAVLPASGPDEAADAARTLGGGAVLVQEALEGTVGFVSALFDRGALVAALCSHKATTFPGPRGGSASLFIVDLPELVDAVAGIGRALGYHGFGGVDWMHLPDGSARVIELHGRPTSHTHLGRFGADFTTALSRMLAGAAPGRVLLAEPRFVGRWMPIFPTELLRCIDDRDAGGFLRAMAHPSLWRDVPWDDPSLLARFPATLTRKAATRSLRRAAALAPPSGAPSADRGPGSPQAVPDRTRAGGGDA